MLFVLSEEGGEKSEWAERGKSIHFTKRAMQRGTVPKSSGAGARRRDRSGTERGGVAGLR